MSSLSQYAVPAGAFAGALAILVGIHATAKNIEPAYSAAPPWAVVALGGITLFAAYKTASGEVI